MKMMLKTRKPVLQLISGPLLYSKEKQRKQLPYLFQNDPLNHLSTIAF